jgi:hypothetical protein
MILYLGSRSAVCPLSPPYPLADMATFDGKLAKASLLGEGLGEGGFPIHPHILCDSGARAR